MLNDYILSKLTALQEEKDDTEKKLEHTVLLQEQINVQINSKLENEDVGAEVFSPRNKVNGIRDEINGMRKQLSDLIAEENALRKHIEKITALVHEYQMLMTSNNASDHAKSMQSADYIEEKHDLKIILEQIEEAREFIDTDPEHAKYEINNLIYFLKALITET